MKYLFVTGVIAASVFIYSIFKRRDSKAEHNTDKKRIHITGSACNMPGHAAIRTDSSDTYLIRGMDAWDKDWIDHRIKVVGDLEVSNASTTAFIGDAVIQLLHDY
jgi:hypothetical protein